MSKRQRRSFTTEEKAEAVRLARASGNISKTARDLDLNTSTLRLWLKAAEAQGPEGALAENEREELLRLRKENKRLRDEAAFLKKVSTYFAKDSGDSK